MAGPRPGLERMIRPWLNNDDTWATANIGDNGAMSEVGLREKKRAIVDKEDAGGRGRQGLWSHGQ